MQERKNYKEQKSEIETPLRRQIVCNHRKSERWSKVQSRRDRLFLGRRVLLPLFSSFTSYLQGSDVHVIQRSDACGPYKAQGETSSYRQDLLPSSSIAFASRGIILILLLHAFICQIYRICFHLCLIRLKLNELHAFHLEILCSRKSQFFLQLLGNVSYSQSSSFQMVVI